VPALVAGLLINRFGGERNRQDDESAALAIEFEDSATKAVNESVCIKSGPACDAITAVLPNIHLSIDETKVDDRLVDLALKIVGNQDDVVHLTERDFVGAACAEIVYQQLLGVAAEDEHITVSTAEAETQAEETYESLRNDTRWLQSARISVEQLHSELLGAESVETRRAQMVKRKFEVSRVTSEVGPEESQQALTLAKAKWLSSELADHKVTVDGWNGDVTSLPALLAASWSMNSPASAGSSMS
jgi:hypothetical protein